MADMEREVLPPTSYPRSHTHNTSNIHGNNITPSDTEALLPPSVQDVPSPPTVQDANTHEANYTYIPHMAESDPRNKNHNTISHIHATNFKPIIDSTSHMAHGDLRLMPPTCNTRPHATQACFENNPPTLLPPNPMAPRAYSPHEITQPHKTSADQVSFPHEAMPHPPINILKDLKPCALTST